MNTVITINLGGKAYGVEESGYALLQAYLKQAEVKLAHNPDKEEILKDFETAIGEKCESYISNKKNVITKEEVEKMITDMGPVEATDSSETKESAKTEAPFKKRLYLDSENAVIGGVASGLAHYFGIDPIIVRVIFLISLLIGGTGFVVYVILWIAVPEAKTSAQKLEMRGSHVSLSAMSDMLREKVEAVKERSVKNKSGIRKIIELPLELLRGIGKIIQKILFPALRILIGVLFACIGFIGALSVTIVAGALLFTNPAFLTNVPVFITSLGSLFYIAVVFGYFVAIIPLVFILLGGTSIIQNKKHLTGKIALSFIIIWSLGLAGAGILGAQIAAKERHILATEPSAQPISQVRELGSFTSLTVANRHTVTYVSAEKYEVTLEGRASDIERVRTEITNGTLTINTQDTNTDFCFLFCFSKKVHITVSAPALENITLKNGSFFTGSLQADTSSITLKNASSAHIELTTKNTTVVLENASHLTISGTAQDTNLVLKNGSNFEGEMFDSKNIDIKSANASYASIGKTSTLQVDASNGSVVEYTGEPKITESLKNGSSLHSVDEDF